MRNFETDTNFDWELRQIEKALLKYHNSAENIMNIFTDISNRVIDKRELVGLLNRTLATDNSEESLKRCEIITKYRNWLKMELQLE